MTRRGEEERGEFRGEREEREKEHAESFLRRYSTSEEEGEGERLLPTRRYTRTVLDVL